MDGASRIPADRTGWCGAVLWGGTQAAFHVRCQTGTPTAGWCHRERRPRWLPDPPRHSHDRE